MYTGPYRVVYILQNVYDNTIPRIKEKYSNILFDVLAIEKANNLFNSLCGYYRDNSSVRISVMVLDGDGFNIKEFIKQ